MTFKSSKKNEEPYNYYFTIILLGLIAQRFFYTLPVLINTNIENKFKFSFIAYYYVPLFYLFIKKYLKYKINQKENLTHFTFASVFVLINLLIKIEWGVKIYYVFYFLYNLYIFCTKKNKIY